MNLYGKKVLIQQIELNETTSDTGIKFENTLKKNKGKVLLIGKNCEDAVVGNEVFWFGEQGEIINYENTECRIMLETVLYGDE